jgi:hypothetical protein
MIAEKISQNLAQCTCLAKINTKHFCEKVTKIGLLVKILKNIANINNRTRGEKLPKRRKITQDAKNRPIWSHWSGATLQRPSVARKLCHPSAKKIKCGLSQSSGKNGAQF